MVVDNPQDTIPEAAPSVDPDHPPEATVVDTSPPWLGDADRDEGDALRWLEEALPELDLEAAGVDPSASFDEVLETLYQSEQINKALFISAHADADIEIGAFLDAPARYHALGFLDEGGVGEIHVARDCVLRRKVAVKQIKSEISNETERARFLREAQITAQLDHPNIIPIYSYEVRGDEAGAVSYAMKLIRGVTLQGIIDAAAEDPSADTDAALRERLELFAKICDAMSYAHAKGIIHRDLKPENVMVGGFGEVYVMDWGLARRVQTDDAKMVSPSGTPYFMSPEQAKGAPAALSPPSDVYALGLILYELCTLRRAIPGDNSVNVIFAAMKGETRPFEHAHPGRRLSPDLAALVAHATRLEPEARYADASEIGEEIRAFLRGEALRVRPDNGPRKIARWIAHHRQLTLAILAALILLSAGAIIWSLASQKATLEAAKLREERLMAWKTVIASHAAGIDRELLRIEEMTQRLGREIQVMLQAPAPAPDAPIPFPFQDEVDADRINPAGFTPAPVYGMHASVRQPFYDLAPGLTLDQARGDLQRLAPLGDALPTLFLDYRYDTPRPLDSTTERALQREVAPLRWAFIGLESGLFLGYPGTTGYPPDYDHRVRPWYKAALEGRGAVVWGQPYYDVQVHKLGLPALMALYEEDTLIGVVNLEILVEHLIDAVLLRAADEDVEMFLLDAQGRVITSSASRGVQTEDAARVDALEPEPYPHAAVLEAVRDQRSGYVELERDGAPTFVAFHRLPTLGWYYVEEIPVEQLLEGSSP